MSRGYSSPLYALPCDQREHLVEGVFGWHEPLDAGQLAAIASVKGVLYSGFRQATDQTMSKREALLVCDDQYGAVILTHAIDRGYLTALSLERGDDGQLRFEHDDVAQTLDRWRLSFAKVRFRFDAAGDAEGNAGVLDRLRALFFTAGNRDLLMMLDLDTPPDQVVRAIEALQDGGVDPDVWVIPPLPRADAELVSALVRSDGRDEVSCLVRGHGAPPARMRAELQEAAKVPAFVGFSVEPEAFADVAAAWRSPNASFADWAARVAARYGDWIESFRSARVTYLTSTGALL
jgi:myo-inositol catabolism protein IolC